MKMVAKKDVDLSIGGKQLSFPWLNFFFSFLPIVCTLLHIRSITIILSYRVVMEQIKKLHFWVLPKISQKKPLKVNFNHIFALQKMNRSCCYTNQLRHLIFHYVCVVSKYCNVQVLLVWNSRCTNVNVELKRPFQDRKQ